jgi:hypothetical protein
MREAPLLLFQNARPLKRVRKKICCSWELLIVACCPVWPLRRTILFANVFAASSLPGRGKPKSFTIVNVHDVIVLDDEE